MAGSLIDFESPGERNKKRKPLARNALDSTAARRQFDAVVRGVTTDLGGEERLSTIQQHLIEAFAGITLTVSDINVRLMCGHRVDLLAHSAAISTMVRVASRIGLHRVAREVPTLDQYLKLRKEEDEHATDAETFDDQADPSSDAI